MQYSHRCFVAAFMAALVTLPALAAVDRASRYYDDAVTRLDAKDTAGAIIQLRNALQQDPKMLAAHVLLGRAYLAGLQPVAAQESLEKALELGADQAEVGALLGRALLEQGRPSDVLARFPADRFVGRQRVEMLVLRSQAHRMDGNLAAAERELAEARAADPASSVALLAVADLYATRGKVDEALKAVDQAIALEPTNAPAWYVKGTVLQASGNLQQALGAFDRALGVDPANTDARVARVALLLGLDRSEQVGPDIDYFLANNAKEPRSNYLRAVYLSRKKDFVGAKAALFEVTRVLDPVPYAFLRARAPEFLLLGGVAHNGLGNLEKASDYLNQYLKVEPQSVYARQMLGSTLIARSEAAAAIAVLEPALRIAPDDPQVLALMASANMARGRHQQATRYLEKALAADASPDVRTQLGVAMLAGRMDKGLKHLQIALESDPGNKATGVALAVALLKGGDPRKALGVAEQIVERHPGDAILLNMLGVMRAANGDNKGARDAYERALKATPDLHAAHLNYARLEVAEGRFDSARKRLLAVTNKNPKDVQVMYELALIEQRAGRADEAIRWLEKVRSVDPRYLPGALYLTGLYLSTGATSKALETIRAAEAYAPSSLEVLEASAQAHLANANPKETQIVLGRMARLADYRPDWQTRIAALQLGTGNLSGAAYSLEKALSDNPDYVPAKVLKVELEIRQGSLDSAESRALALSKSAGTEGIGFRLLGDVQAQRGRWVDALVAYRAALAKAPVTEAALRVFEAEYQTSGPEKALAFLERWTRDRPKDIGAGIALAENYLRAGKLAEARGKYESLLPMVGDSAGLLNNMAIVYSRLGEAKVALSYAERAHARAPENPAIQDTYGWVLVQNGALDAGLKHLRDARLRDPRNPEIRYHLAYALAKIGRADDARTELVVLLKENASFEAVSDARKLMEQLGPRSMVP